MMKLLAPRDLRGLRGAKQGSTHVVDGPLRIEGGKMSVLRSKKKILALTGSVLLAGVLAGAGISALTAQVVVADFTNIHFRVVSSAASDFDSGWHTHPGLTIVQVQKGSLQFTTQGSCTPKTVSAGETFIETPFVPVRATGTGQVVWTTTFLVRYEDPVTAPLPTNPCS